jgi:hypothetical protein
MRSLKLFFVSLVAALLANGFYVGTAVAATCTSSQTGDWDQTTTWSCAAVPTSSDDVIIQSPHTVTITANGAAKTVTIQNGGTLQFDGNYTLTLTPANSDTAFDLVDGGNFVTNNTGTVRINVASASSQAFIAGNPSFHNLTLARLSNGRGVVDFMGSSLTVSNELQMNTTTTFNVEDKTVNIGSIVFTNTSLTTTEQRLNFTDSTVTIGSALPSGNTFGTINFTNATVTVLGNLNPNQAGGANAWTFAGSTVVFAGSNFQTVVGTLSFADVIVNNGAVVQIAVDTVTANSLTNNGTIQQTQNVTGPGNFTFLGLGSYGGVQFTTSNNLGSTTVVIRGNQACDTTNSTVRRCFDIAPTNALATDIAFYFDNEELNGSVCANASVYRWSSGWNEIVPASRQCDTEPYSLVISNQSDFSPFVIRAGTPTAVTLHSLTATAATPLWAILLFTFTAMVAAVTLIRRHRLA